MWANPTDTDQPDGLHNTVEWINAKERTREAYQMFDKSLVENIVIIGLFTYCSCNEEKGDLIAAELGVRIKLYIHSVRWNLRRPQHCLEGN